MNHPTVTEVEAEILRRLRRIDWLEAENQRLREALDRIANLASDWSTCEAHVRTAQVGLHAPGIARAALGEKA